MKFDILEHDQIGTSIYEVWNAPFSEEDWSDGKVISEEDCQKIVDRYIDVLTKETLNAFTTTSYSAQPHGEFA
jgi:hypothetical protein